MLKTILVTGGTGLVGHGLQSIRNQYPEFHFIWASSSDVNLLDFNATSDFFKSSNPDYVIHLAANVGGLFKNIAEPVKMLEDNLTMNSNVLKASHECGVQRLIGCLSTCIFPDDIVYPIDETKLHLGPPHSSNAPYAYAKRMLQVGCDVYNKQYGREYTCIIPTNIYGPHDNFHLENSHVIPGLIHKCHLAKAKKEPFIIAGSGKPLRQFIYSEDLAHAIMQLLTTAKPVPSIIISCDPSDEITIETVGRLIAKELDYEHMIEFDKTKSDGQYKKTASNALFRELYPDFTFMPFEEGIRKTIEWFQSQWPNVRK